MDFGWLQCPPRIYIIIRWVSMCVQLVIAAVLKTVAWAQRTVSTCLSIATLKVNVIVIEKVCCFWCTIEVQVLRRSLIISVSILNITHIAVPFIKATPDIRTSLISYEGSLPNHGHYYSELVLQCWAAKKLKGGILNNPGSYGSPISNQTFNLLAIVSQTD